MANIDLHNCQKRLKSEIERIDKEVTISQRNRADIIYFSKIRFAKGSGYGRVAKIAYSMRCWAKWLGKPFREVNKNDLITAVGELENTKYSEYTKYDLKIVLKMFYRWLEGNDETLPKKISWLKPGIKNEKHKLPEELLNEEEVLKIAEATGNIRDRAFVLVLYESGCRIGEMLTLKLKNIGFDQYGAVLRVNGKTGDRRVRIISSAPALAAWMEMHPIGKEPEAMLWQSRWRDPKQGTRNLCHGTVNQRLKEFAVRAGVKKRVYPHLFRHSRATALANKLTEAQMKEHFGWVQGSGMAATYVHLSGRDVDNTLLRLQGVVQAEETKSGKLSIRICPRCKDRNAPVSKYCIKCGLPLEENLIVKADTVREKSNNLMNRLLEDKGYVEFTRKKMTELGIERRSVE
jgi:site-specific recombinase XerD/ribosomal protein L40E